MDNSPVSDWSFFRRVLIVLAIVTIAYILWKIAALFMLFFAAVFLAVLLTGLAGVVVRYTPLSSGGALALSCFVVATVLLGIGAFSGSQIQAQVSRVFTQLPEAIDAAGSRLGISDAFMQIREAFSADTSGQLLSRVASVGYTALGLVTDLILVIVVAIYIAANPRLYRMGLLSLFPAGQHARLGEALNASATALRLWFVGQLVSIISVALLCSIAFWLIGLDSPVGLGVIAGVTNFVPLIGPIVGALPAIVLALGQDFQAIVWTLIAVLAIQQLEGNLITPMIQKRAVDVPPALIFVGISAFGTLGGMLGVILAAPLTVLVMVLVQRLWIRDTLSKSDGLRSSR